jgi:hypothetical protein
VDCIVQSHAQYWQRLRLSPRYDKQVVSLPIGSLRGCVELGIHRCLPSAWQILPASRSPRTAYLLYLDLAFGWFSPWLAVSTGVLAVPLPFGARNSEFKNFCFESFGSFRICGPCGFHSFVGCRLCGLAILRVLGVWGRSGEQGSTPC